MTEKLEDAPRDVAVVVTCHMLPVFRNQHGRRGTADDTVLPSLTVFVCSLISVDA